MMELKKKKKREYLNDFKLNESGEYEYRGIMYGWPENGRARGKLLGVLWGTLASSGVAVVLDGCISGTGLEHRSFMMLPYMIQLVLLVSLFWSGGSLSFAGTKIREYVFERTVKRIPMQAAGLMILSGICIVMGAISILMPDFIWDRKMAVIWLVLEMFVFACSCVLKKVFTDVKSLWKKL